MVKPEIIHPEFLMGENGTAIHKDEKRGYILMTEGKCDILGTNKHEVIEKLTELGKLDDFKLDELETLLDNK